MKKLEYSININASAEKVWNTMLQPESYQQWVGVDWPGSTYKGEWKQGEEVEFIGKDGSGTLAEMKTLEPYKTVAAVHTAVLLPGGVRDTTSALASGWIGTRENYWFTETDGQTHLQVEMETNPDYEKMFNDGWPVALKKLKEIVEG